MRENFRLGLMLSSIMCRDLVRKALCMEGLPDAILRGLLGMKK